MLATIDVERFNFAMTNFKDIAIFIMADAFDRDAQTANTALIFDIQSQTFIEGPAMNYSRKLHAATSTKTSVIVFGGFKDFNTSCKEIEMLKV